jgi:uncharacterized protein YpbB
METQHHATKQNLTWKLQHKFKKLECQHGTIIYIYYKGKPTKDHTIEQACKKNSKDESKVEMLHMFMLMFFFKPQKEVMLALALQKEKKTQKDGINTNVKSSGDQ